MVRYKMYAFIYRMSWVESSRHIKPHTLMYFSEPRHTYCGYDDPLCRIELIRVRTDTDEYNLAVRNSKRNQERIDNGTYEWDENGDYVHRKSEYSNLGKVKDLGEEYITIRGDLPYCLEITYAVPDSLKPHMKDIMENPELYLHDSPRLTKDYQKCCLVCVVIEKTTDDKFDVWKRDYILYPTETDQLWLKKFPV